MKRRKIAAGNWKMNLRRNEALQLAMALRDTEAQAEVILFPPFVYLTELIAATVGKPIQYGAQNLCDRENGAFTGEISAPMLQSIGVSHVLIGHSERRQYFHEDHELLKTKLQVAMSYGLHPVFCCGEPREVRLAEQQENYVMKQLEESLFALSEEAMQQVVIAYEPVWAIGTGLTATPGQAQEMHAFIRKQLNWRYGADVAQQVRILYGGSVTAGNAAALFTQPDVDGGLVGGASLKAEDFTAIIHAAS
ncbi:MAG: triose-phosphate isomerase [Chitinophagales bacterium]